MRLNGWQRLWIVASVGWMMLAGLMLAFSTPSPPWTTTHETTDRILNNPEAWLASYQAKLQHADITRAVSEAKRETIVGTDISAYLRRTNPWLIREIEGAVARVDRERMDREWRMYFVLAVPVLGIPPAFLYLMGVATAWIRRGFRSA